VNYCKKRNKSKFCSGAEDGLKLWKLVSGQNKFILSDKLQKILDAKLPA
jgi:hypothetical protein